MKNFKRNAVILSVALAMAATSVSQAVPTLRITDGFTSVTVVDGGVGDKSPVDGNVLYQAAQGTFAGWTVVVSIGATKPLIGSATSPQLDLNWQITRDSDAANQLMIFFSDTDFNLAGPTQFTHSSGGTLGTSEGNSATINTYYAADNVALNTASLLTSQVFNGPGAFSANTPGNAPVPADPSVSFTISLTLNQAAGQVSSGDIHLYTNVPEGGSMVTFLGTALLALGAFAARRKA